MKNIFLAFLAVVFLSFNNCAQTETDFFSSKKEYAFSAEPIDVVFVCHPKDLRTLNLAIDGIRNNGRGVRDIYVVSKYKMTDKAEWFDEQKFPFSKKDIALEIFNNERQAKDYMSSKNSRIGWVYQQMLKLYSPFVIPGISSNVLIVDADTIFLNETEFKDANNNPLFNVGSEHTAVYFEHGERLLKGFRKIKPDCSGISHHMLLQRPILEDLFYAIKLNHTIDPWRAFCRCIQIKDLPGSALSEYEIYFNFALARSDQVKIRKLTWENARFNVQRINECRDAGYNYISCHAWMN